MTSNLITKDTAILAQRKGFTDPDAVWKSFNTGFMCYKMYQFPVQEILQKWLRLLYKITVEVRMSWINQDAPVYSYTICFKNYKNKWEVMNGEYQSASWDAVLEEGLKHALQLIPDAP